MARMNQAEFKTECARRRDAGLSLSGNTYPIKDAIKAAGGIWDGQQRAWLMPDEDSLKSLREQMVPPKATPQHTRQGSDRCLDCGGLLSAFDHKAAAVPGYHFDCV